MGIEQDNLLLNSIHKVKLLKKKKEKKKGEKLNGAATLTWHSCRFKLAWG